MSKIQTIIIDSNKPKLNYWKDIWRFKNLFYFLAWRDILVRYKQTIIGILWSVLQPIIAMMIFVLIFARVAKLNSITSEIPYSIMVFIGLLPWQFFSNGVNMAANSIISNTNMISKIYFPRLIIPGASVIVAFVDFIFAIIVLAILMLFYKIPLSINIIFLPIFLLLVVLFILGMGLFFAALNVKYRDFRIIVPFILQISMYISPVGFNTLIVPENLKFYYAINPMVGIIEGFRWCILGDMSKIYMPGLYLGTAIIFISLYIGIKTFKNMEKSFADII